MPPPEMPSSPSVNVRTVARTVWLFTWLWMDLLFFVLVLGPYLWVASRTFDRQRRRARAWVRRLYRHFLRGYCTPRGMLTVDAFDWSRTNGPCILVANHQSMLDVIMMMQLPIDARCWAKEWPFKIPLLGILMRLSGHLFIEDFNILPDSTDVLADDVSLYVFPESTRSRTGKMGRFHDGAFLVAARTGRPIVPVAIHGTFECFKPDQMWIRRAALRIEPLGVLWPDKNDPRAHIALKRHAHELIAQALNQGAAARVETHEPLLKAS